MNINSILNNMNQTEQAQLRSMKIQTIQIISEKSKEEKQWHNKLIFLNEIFRTVSGACILTEWIKN